MLPLQMFMLFHLLQFEPLTLTYFAVRIYIQCQSWALIPSSSPESISHHSNCCPIQRQLSTEGRNTTAIKM
ncbi:uncharacterized protein C8R40DRAFT_1115458 [Lentinula edodes]|uniref:uncharacterized protein n=1 Tax=Lentinula edodes TaxID=5353 RepID=UPI001E8D6AB8|nr:uncharacterized protein C8R40DRAFT_1115458 [Lentinula edodes]KAH7872747.1 hypothetical protein C8R40DRAFT_1115458 [Lentinula edodes]